MTFHTHGFILLFLPLTVVVYFYLHRKQPSMVAKAWLVLTSFLFYGLSDWTSLPILSMSLLLNFLIGALINRRNQSHSHKRWLLRLGIGGNLILLAFFKYTDFFIRNLNHLFSLNVPYLQIDLPLGLSFITFTQIAYLVDTARGSAREDNFINYALLVTFFPRLVVGPIVRHQEIIPQFEDPTNRFVNYKNVAQGLVLFSMGLFKKVVIADTLAKWANAGYEAASLGFLEAWMTSLSYTLQIYYDFSGYTDMALGVGLIFNIRLPINFNTPYRALDVQDFWRRWHITLGRFVRDYIYIPLGGRRVTEPRLVGNLLFTFFLVGLWHGAGWTFVIWGLLHGGALVGLHFWRKTSFRLPPWLSWILTFHFINISWIFFRAQNLSEIEKVLKGMAGMTGIVLPPSWGHTLGPLRSLGVQFGEVFESLRWSHEIFFWFVIGFFLSIFLKNSQEWAERFKPSWKALAILSAILLYALSNLQEASDFIYFNF